MIIIRLPPEKNKNREAKGFAAGCAEIPDATDALPEATAF